MSYDPYYVNVNMYLSMRYNIIILIYTFQLNAKFDKLKREQDDQKKRLEDQRRKYEDDLMEFSKRKQQYTNMGHHTLTLGKSKKK